MSFFYYSFIFVLILIGFLLILEIFNRIRYLIYTKKVLNITSGNFPCIKNFKIINPYRLPGNYCKAQLHLHTSNSNDVRNKLPIGECTRQYKEASYNFLVITDHNKVTDYPFLNSEYFLAMPGK